jgi:hypothetical protein
MTTSKQYFEAARNLRDLTNQAVCPITKEYLSAALSRLLVVAAEQRLHEIDEFQAFARRIEEAQR